MWNVNYGRFGVKDEDDDDDIADTQILWHFEYNFDDCRGEKFVLPTMIRAQLGNQI